ncbi:MAG TPA: PKD domain-containing protein [Thermoanaerobaculia bacterium]
MTQTLRRISGFVFVFALAFSAYGQNWAKPAKTPNTPVPCAGCTGVLPDALTVGYGPGMTFLGRFLDSDNTTDFQGTFRTGRAAEVQVSDALNRVYIRVGSSVFAYNKDLFFQRLESGEALLPSTAVPVKPSNARPAGQVETFLKWDEWFAPEFTSATCPGTSTSPTCWQTPKQDGQDRIVAFDVDDQGYVYIAATIFGWGIVKDNLTTGSAGFMTTQSQVIGNVNSKSPFAIGTAKGSRQYAFVSGNSSSVWDVTNRKAPVFMRTMPIPLQWFAKNSDQTVVGATDAAGTFSIYTADQLAAGGQPLATEAGCRGASSDGSAFYTSKVGPNGLSIITYTPTGTGGYTRREDPAGVSLSVSSIQVGAGFITISGTDSGGAWDARVFRLSNGTPTAIAIASVPAPQTQYTSYFRNYYSSPPILPPATYVKPFISNLQDGVVARANGGRIYLIICDYGLGDVYELPAGPTVAITKTQVGTVNPNTPADRNAKIFYGDPLQFVGTSTDATATTLSWDFGNPESGIANTIQLPAGQLTPVPPLQYSNLTPAKINTKTVATNALANPAIKGTIPIALTMPTVAFKIAGQTAASLIFTQPNASSPAPIVVGDSFVDASDGRGESHFVDWNIDGVSNKLTPVDPTSGQPILQPVGQCGAHTLAFTAHYGPYSGTGAALATIPGPTGVVDFPVALNLGYTVQPFAAALTLASSNASAITFNDASRFADRTGITYQWSVIDANGGSVPFTPTTGVTTPSALPVLPLGVPKSLFGTQRNLRVQLTLTSATPLLGCTTQTSTAVSSPLNGPDPVDLVPTGVCANAPCSFTASSASGVDPVADGWTFAWQVLNSLGQPATPGTDYTAVPLTQKTLNLAFMARGTFTIQLTVNNPVGVATKTSQPITVTTPVISCKPLTPNAWTVGYAGTTSGCGVGTACTAGETISFFAGSPLGFNDGYDPLCAAHTFTWTFGDGQPAVTGQTSADGFGAAPHAYAVNGTYTVTLTVFNGAATQSYSGSVRVGNTPPPPPPPPPPDRCALNSSNFSLRYSAAAGGSGCSSATNSTCKNGETLSFIVDTTGSCPTNTFAWVFPDGTASGPQTTHSFSATGSHLVTVTITNSVMQPVQKTVVVNTSDNPGSCQTISANVSLFIDYFNPSHTCGPLSNSACAAGESLSFTVQQSFPYDIGCANHSFDWDFGDGSPHASTRDVVHQFPSGGATFNVKCTVSNGQQTVTLVQPVAISGNPGQGDAQIDIAFESGSSPQQFKFTAIVDEANAGKAASYTWDFGETGGTPFTTADKSVSYAYKTSGKFNVTLKVFDASNVLLGPPKTVTVTVSDRRRAVRGGKH